MTYEEFKEYCYKNYKPKYAVSLALNEKNLIHAWEVYKLGIEYCYSLMKAVTTYWGFRYRRLENFCRELKIYEEKKWIHVKTLLKNHGLYIRRKKLAGVSIELDFDYETVRPLCVKTIDETFMDELFIKYIQSLPSNFAVLQRYVSIERWERGDINHIFIKYEQKEHEDNANLLIIDGKGHAYSYTGIVITTMYSPFKFMKYGQKQKADIGEIKEVLMY
jgi:hypothetical protein